MPGVVQLSIDYGAVDTVALARYPESGWAPLLFDASPVLVNAVHVSDGAIVAGAKALQMADSTSGDLELYPRRRLGEGQVHGGGSAVEAVDLVAATLRQVADAVLAAAGRPADEVVMVVPAVWGPRRRTLLRQAAHRAGLPSPRLVEAPVAVARHLQTTGTQIPVGRWIAVCDVGATTEASVVRRTADGWEVLATIADDAGALAVDAAVADELLSTVTTATQQQGPLMPVQLVDVTAAVAAARRSLTVSDSVVVPLPAPLPAVVLTHSQVRKVAAAAVDAAAHALRQAIVAAEVSPPDCVGVWVLDQVGLPGIAERGAEVLRAADAGSVPHTPSVQVIPDPRWVAVRGAVDASAATNVSAAAEDVPVPPPPPVRRVLGVAVPAFVSLALWGHFLSEAQLYTYIDPRGNYMIGPWGELAVAGVMAVLACLCAGMMLAAVLPPPVTLAPLTPGLLQARRVATGVLAALGLGVSVATMYALIASITFGLPIGRFLHWLLYPTVPVVVLGALAALAVWRLGGEPAEGWHAWFAFPLRSAALAGLGAAAAAKGLYAPGTTGVVVNQVLIHGGGALLGVAAAFAVGAGPRSRVILSGPLAALGAALIAWFTFDLMAAGYGLAAGVWWGRRAWQFSAAAVVRRRDRAA